MPSVVVLFGSNSGDRLHYVKKAIQQIEAEIGKITNISPLYESEPWGFDDETWFINGVLIVETELEAENVLSKLLSIENSLGRRRTDSERYESRTIDLDILFYNEIILESENLVIPHPRLHKRRFTLLPLNYLLPDFVHPKLNKTIGQILDNCDDKGEVRLFQSL
ncbi:MAG: 2-amino-4-hydroxy-6-hydroxymethyldihydropteridine diphosphokinase [Bacteroidales bacterium]|jgi:2-amino-4-hydroxy-6-hydroxymethyldihydropteridine diphosphokinase|nr:2-amino-4-hydroxy-6-hydroxymethyldihydropteridine diphosphokinase [Bacteroidales bacterium]